MSRSTYENSPLPPHGDVIATARALADGLLFPEALDIDRAPVVPARYLDAFAAAGLYGLLGPASAGGLEADGLTAARVIEAIGGASLAAAFIWIQHHGVVRAIAAARKELRDLWLEPLCQGRIRGGVAIGGLRRTGPPVITAEPAGNGWILDGRAPWVSGWERVDVVLVGARSGDQIVWVLIDSVAGSSLRVQPLELAACNSTSTVELELRRHPVSDGRVVDVEPFADWQQRDSLGLRTNGYLSIGVAARCASLLESASFAHAVDAARRALDDVDGADVIAARAEASLLAVRLATAQVVAGRGHAVDLRSHAQRLAREAMFLLVFGQTGPIRAAQLERLTAPM
jgi:alkylation response protein AidB-like acyl-CoA dehydrogenase